MGGGGRLYAYRYTVTTRMTYALRWAAMRAVLMFQNCEGQNHKQDSVHRPQLLKRFYKYNFWAERSTRMPEVIESQTRQCPQTTTFEKIL